MSVPIPESAPPADTKATAGTHVGLMKAFDEAREYLRGDLAKVRLHMDEVMHPGGMLMRQVARYVHDSQGKMLRPSMVALFSRAHGMEAGDDRHCRLGAAMEIFHMASLLHDDVIDKSPLRRGRPTVNAKWGDDVAILFADYLYASCFDLSMSILDPGVMRIITKTTQRMTEGEMFQIERRGQPFTIDDYMIVVESKTAALFGACAALGTLVGGGSSDRVLRMSDFGMAFGTAFQITDDTLDYEANGSAWGKPVGGDAEEGKPTLPVLYALGEASPEDRAMIDTLLAEGHDFPALAGLVRKYGGVRHAHAEAKRHIDRAVGLLDELDNSQAATRHLRGLTQAILDRRY